MKKKVIIGGIIIVAALAGYFIYQSFFVDSDADALEYEFAKAVKKDISIVVPVDGKVVFDTWDLSFQNSGVVESINIALGEIVEKGQKLATIDGSKTQTQLSQSNATLQADIIDMERLSEDGVDYKIKKDAYKAAKDREDAEEDLYDEIKEQNGKDSSQALAQRIRVKSAEADVDNLKRQMEQVEKSYEEAGYQVKKSQAAYNNTRISAYDDTITSPVNSVVVAQIHGNEGKVISSAQNSSDPFITLADPQEYWFESYVEDAEALKINADMKVRMTIEAYPDEEFEGRVVFVSPVAEVDQNDLSTYKALFTIDDTSLKMLSDMTGSAEVIIEESGDVLTVPTEAVQVKDGVQFVIVRKNGEFEQKTITTGFTDGKDVEVTSGIVEGEEIVIIK